MPSVVLFYKYFVPSPLLLERFPEHYVQVLYKHQLELCRRLDLKGRVLIAVEGINGSLCAPSNLVLQEYISSMESFNLSNGKLLLSERANAIIDGANVHDEERQLIYSDVDWKKSTSSVSEPFPDLKISIVKEIVSTGGILSAKEIPTFGGKHLTPREFHNVLTAEEDVVLIDVRNTFEHEIGHFVHPTTHEAAINPNMVAFSSFDSIFCEKQAEALKDKKVLMYCTGGIRCEKASAMLRKRGVDNVCQLQGGIHRYLEEFGEKEDSLFMGKNFVFDQRVSMPDSSKTANSIVGKCVECTLPFDEISGSRICTVCRDLVLVCPTCHATLREYHCRRHSNLKHCYFTFLEVFDKHELTTQKKQLEEIWKSRLLPPGLYKNFRRTLKRQITKIDKRLEELKLGEPKADRKAPRRCRTCTKTSDECNGNCWGFWKQADTSDLGERKKPCESKNESSLDSISSTTLLK